MRIKKGYELVNRSGQSVIISKNKATNAPDNTIILTETAVFLWNLLKEKEVTKTDMLNALIENFDISTFWLLEILMFLYEQ